MKFLFLSHGGYQKHFYVEQGECLEEIYFYTLQGLSGEFVAREKSVGAARKSKTAQLFQADNIDKLNNIGRPDWC